MTRPCIETMITQFRLVDREGTVLAHGEIDGDIYRLFSDRFLGGYKEFENLKDMFAECGGNAIQPELFESPARARQLRVF